MKDKPLFIADGHHRYETALFYRNLVKGSVPLRCKEEAQKGSKENSKSTGGNGNLPSDYVMMMCVAMDDPGLQILPTHRLVKDIENLNPEKVKNSLNEVFEVSEMGKDCSIELLMNKLRENINTHAFILYIGQEEKEFFMLKLRDKTILDQTFKNEFSDWRSIDTGILHGLVFDKILGIKTENTSKTNCIKYVQDERQAIASVNKGTYQLAFFLNPTRIDQVKDIALKRHKMPPKATYFYPKLMTGMVIRHISDM